MMKKSLIGLGIALAVLAGCFLSLMAGGMAGGIIGYLSGRRAARAHLPRLWQEFGPSRGPWQEEPERWRQPPEPQEFPPEEMTPPSAWERSVALITEVTPGDPADEAGVEVGDIILAVDGRVMGERHDLSGLIRRYEPGDQVVLTVLRPGEGMETMEIEVTLGRQTDEEGEVIPRLGVTYQPMRVGMHIMPRGRGLWD